MKKLYLHIGTGKTGSSSIQKTFKNLNERNFYFKYDRKALRFVEKLDQIIEKLETCKEDLVILSSEWLYVRADEKILKKINKLSSKFEIKIIIYLRRQDELVVSAYQQSIKNLDSKIIFNVDDYALNNAKLYSKWFLKRTNYYEICNFWSNYFGKENIIIRIFSKNQLKDGCVVKDFASIVNVPIKQSQIINRNQGIGKIAMNLAIRLRKLNVKKELARKIIFNAPKSEPALPERDTIKQFYQQFIELNQKLKKEFKIQSQYNSIFSSDFSKYPKKETYTLDKESNDLALNFLQAKLDETKGLARSSQNLFNIIFIYKKFKKIFLNIIKKNETI